ETCDRTENLLLGARASGGHVGENRRGVEVPGPVEGLPAQQQTRSRFDCFLDLLAHLLPNGWSRQGPDLGRRIEGISDLERSHLLHESPLQLGPEVLVE